SASSRKFEGCDGVSRSPGCSTARVPCRYTPSSYTSNGTGSVMVASLTGRAPCPAGIHPRPAFGDAEARGARARRSGVSSADAPPAWCSTRSAPHARVRNSFSSCLRSRSFSGLPRHCSMPLAMIANPARSRALETAESWATTSLQAVPSSSMRTTAPIWPWARLRRLITAVMSAGSSSMKCSSGRRLRPDDIPQGVYCVPPGVCATLGVHAPSTGGPMLLERIYDEDLSQTSYLIACQASGEAIVVDPRRDIQVYLDLAAQHGLTIAAVTET